MALNYDSFICTLRYEDGSIWQTQIRHYDAGKETTDGGKGKYQQWTHDTQLDSRTQKMMVYHNFQTQLFESGWKLYYSSLSDEDKQKYIENCTLRASQKKNVQIRTVPLVIVKPKPDRRSISESLSGLRDLC